MTAPTTGVAATTATAAGMSTAAAAGRYRTVGARLADELCAWVMDLHLCIQGLYPDRNADAGQTNCRTDALPLQCAAVHCCCTVSQSLFRAVEFTFPQGRPQTGDDRIVCTDADP